MKDFETKNLVIRKFKMKDVDDVHKNLATDSRLIDCMGYTIHKNVEETAIMVASFIKEYEMNELIWAIEDKSKKEVIGFINAFERSDKNKICKFKFGIALDYAHTGLMEEALTEVFHYLFEVKNFDVLFSEFYDGSEEVKNIKSSILENVGMKQEAVIHKVAINEKTGKAENRIIYAIFK